jgi:hypothetical protein
MADNKKDNKKVDSGIKSAIVDIADNLSKVFKKYTRHTREKAWKVLLDTEAEKEMKKLLQDPSRSLNMFSKLNFKEWLSQS